MMKESQSNLHITLVLHRQLIWAVRAVPVILLYLDSIVLFAELDKVTGYSTRACTLPSHYNYKRQDAREDTNRKADR